jgi:hypothetical protein
MRNNGINGMKVISPPYIKRGVSDPENYRGI